jgi:PadR family transcriptional regulator PadR
VDLFMRSSGSTTAVALALAEEPATWRYCWELCQRLDLWAGVVYPALMRLADSGLLETGWDAEAAAGRPRRHRYRLTGRGVELAEPLGHGRVARIRGVFGLDLQREAR